MRYEFHPAVPAQNHNTAAFLPGYFSVVHGQVINGAVVVSDQAGLALNYRIRLLPKVGCDALKR